MNREPLTWFCTICHRERPDDRISVFTRDTSERLGFPPGTVRENIRYCNDSPLCKYQAPFYSHFGRWGSIDELRAWKQQANRDTPMSIEPLAALLLAMHSHRRNPGQNRSRVPSGATILAYLQSIERN